MPLKAEHFDSEEFDRYQDIDQNVLDGLIRFGSTGCMKKYMRLIIPCNVVKRKKDVKSILDVGCSTAIFIRFMYNHFRVLFDTDYAYYGFDGNEKSIKSANKWLDKASGNKWYSKTKIVHADIFNKQTWIDAGKQHDVVLLTEVIEHIPFKHTDTLLKLCKRAMADDGTFIFSTPVHHSINEKMYWPDMHDHEFTKDEVEDMLKRNGFTIDETIGYSASTPRFKRLLKANPQYKATYDSLRRITGHYFATAIVDTMMCTELGVAEMYFAVCSKTKA